MDIKFPGRGPPGGAEIRRLRVIKVKKRVISVDAQTTELTPKLLDTRPSFSPATSSSTSAPLRPLGRIFVALTSVSRKEYEEVLQSTISSLTSPPTPSNKHDSRSGRDPKIESSISHSSALAHWIRVAAKNSQVSQQLLTILTGGISAGLRAGQNKKRKLASRRFSRILSHILSLPPPLSQPLTLTLTRMLKSACGLGIDHKRNGISLVQEGKEARKRALGVARAVCAIAMEISLHPPSYPPNSNPNSTYSTLSPTSLSQSLHTLIPPLVTLATASIQKNRPTLLSVACADAALICLAALTSLPRPPAPSLARAACAILLLGRSKSEFRPLVAAGLRDLSRCLEDKGRILPTEWWRRALGLVLQQGFVVSRWGCENFVMREIGEVEGSVEAGWKAAEMEDRKAREGRMVDARLRAERSVPLLAVAVERMGGEDRVPMDVRVQLARVVLRSISRADARSAGDSASALLICFPPPTPIFSYLGLIHTARDFTGLAKDQKSSSIHHIGKIIARIVRESLGKPWAHRLAQGCGRALGRTGAARAAATCAIEKILENSDPFCGSYPSPSPRDLQRLFEAVLVGIPGENANMILQVLTGEVARGYYRRNPQAVAGLVKEVIERNAKECVVFRSALTVAMRVTSENPEALICLFNAIQCGVSSNLVSNGDSDSTVLQKPSEILQYSTSGVSEGSPHEDSRVARVVSTIDHWHGEIDSNTYSVALPEICSRFLHTPSQPSLIRFLSALRPHLSKSPTLSTLLRRILPSLEILRDSKKFLRGSKEISGADSETTLYRQLAPLLVLRVLSDKAFDDGGTNEETRIRARVRVELERWVAEGVGLAVEARRLAAEILGRFPGHAGGGAALMRIESALKHRPPDHTARSQDFKQSAQGQWLARLNLSLYTLCKGLLFRPGEMLRIPGFLQRILMLSKEIFETFSTNSHQISDTLPSPSPVPSARAQASAVEGMVEVLGCCFSRTISQDKPPAPDYESLPNFPLHLLYLAITSPEESKVQPHSLRVRLGYLAGITCGIDRLRGGEIIGIFSRASEETKSPSEGCLAKVVLTRVRKILDDERETFLLPSLLQILFSLTLRASNPYPVTPAGRPPEAGPKDPKVARSIKAAVSSYVSELLQTATEVLDLLGHSAQAHSLRAALGVDVAAVRLAGALLALPGVTDVEDAGNRDGGGMVEMVGALARVARGTTAVSIEAQSLAGALAQTALGVKTS